MKALRYIFIMIFLGIFAYAAWNIYGILSEYQKGDKTYSDLEQYIHIPEVGEEDEESEETFPEVDFDALKKLNPDIVAWIYAPGTHMNYPVVQAKDNDYYLHRMFTGEDNRAGSIFMDFANRPDFTDLHSILYGHHMRNGAMFHDLSEYKDQKYYEEHKVIYLLTPERDYDVEILAGHVAKPDSDAWTIFPGPGEDYEAWVAKMVQESCFTSRVEVKPEDRILTLSTCSYEFDDARFVLEGILRERN